MLYLFIDYIFYYIILIYLTVALESNTGEGALSVSACKSSFLYLTTAMLPCRCFIRLLKSADLN